MAGIRDVLAQIGGALWNELPAGAQRAINPNPSAGEYAAMNPEAPPFFDQSAAVGDRIRALNAQGRYTEAIKAVQQDPMLGLLASFAGPIKAYHGSPYLFDKFDASKIGTGEGAQAYGHGLYFAENPGVAESYKRSTSDLKDWPVLGAKEGLTIPSWVGKSINMGDIDHVLNDFRNRADVMKAQGHWNAAGIKDIADALAAIKAGKATTREPGSLYEVQINAEPHQFLDWDKPLATQAPEVQNAARSAMALAAKDEVLPIATPNGPHPFVYRRPNDPRFLVDATGRDIYQGSKYFNDRTNPVDQSAQLKAAGIPGIKYLDQGSRGAGEGTRNYVVFDPSIVDILKRFGILGPAAAGGIGQVLNQLQGDNGG